MNYIDKNVRKINQEGIIGIITCKQVNKYVIKYCFNAREYKLV